MDKDANRVNSETPSPMVSFDNQIVYRLGTLEATISNSLRRLDEKFDRLQSELHDRHVESTAALTALSHSVDNRFALKRTRIDGIQKELNEVKNKAEVVAEAKSEVDKLCDRMDRAEKWQTILTTRISVIGGTVILLWTIFGDYVRQAIGTNI